MPGMRNYLMGAAMPRGPGTPDMSKRAVLSKCEFRNLRFGICVSRAEGNYPGAPVGISFMVVSCTFRQLHVSCIDVGASESSCCRCC